MRVVRDSPRRPDPGFADLYRTLPDATDLRPWLDWCLAARPPVLYLGVGAGRLAAPLTAAGVALVGLDAHPGMLELLRARLPALPVVRALAEAPPFAARFELVIAPSSLLARPARMAAAAELLAPGGRLGLEVMNPHWLRAVRRRDVRVIRMSRSWASLEIDYPGGFIQRAAGRLLWPEQLEGRLRRCGLSLVEMNGAGPDIARSPTYWALASKRFRRAQMPSI